MAMAAGHKIGQSYVHFILYTQTEVHYFNNVKFRWMCAMATHRMCEMAVQFEPKLCYMCSTPININQFLDSEKHFVIEYDLIKMHFNILYHSDLLLLSSLFACHE